MTDERLAAIAARRAKRDKHPARSARVLVTGVSMSALASLVSAFTVQAANNQHSSSVPIEPEADGASMDPAATSVAPPTLPGAATPAPVRHVVEVNVVQPPTPVAAAPSSDVGTIAIDSGAINLGSSGLGSSGGLSGGGSSGGSGGSH